MTRSRSAFAAAPLRRDSLACIHERKLAPRAGLEPATLRL